MEHTPNGRYPDTQFYNGNIGIHYLIVCIQKGQVYFMENTNKNDFKWMITGGQPTQETSNDPGDIG